MPLVRESSRCKNSCTTLFCCHYFEDDYFVVEGWVYLIWYHLLTRKTSVHSPHQRRKHATIQYFIQSNYVLLENQVNTMRWMECKKKNTGVKNRAMYLSPSDFIYAFRIPSNATIFWKWSKFWGNPRKSDPSHLIRKILLDFLWAVSSCIVSHSISCLRSPYSLTILWMCSNHVCFYDTLWLKAEVGIPGFTPYNRIIAKTSCGLNQKLSCEAVLDLF